MAYRTLRQGASEASVPEDRADYVDYESTPERRLIANALSFGVPAGALTGAGARALMLSRMGRIKGADGAMRAAGTPEQLIALNTLPVMLGAPAAVTGTALPTALQGADVRPNSAATVNRGFGDIPMPQGPERSPEQVLMDQVNREREAADAIPQREYQKPARMPLPVRRPAALDQQPAPEQGLLSRIFSGQDYQSSNALASDPRLAGYSARVVQDGNVNWGDRDSAADFFRADKAMMAQREAAKKDEEDTGKAKGGAVAGKDAAIHKALEIIHHLLTRGH
jgi:hypothetical protein